MNNLGNSNYSRGGEINMNMNQINNYGNNSDYAPMPMSQNNQPHSYVDNSLNNNGVPFNYIPHDNNMQPSQNFSAPNEQINNSQNHNLNYNSYPYPPINMSGMNLKNEHLEHIPSSYGQNGINNVNSINGNPNPSNSNPYYNKVWTPSGEKLRMAANNILR
jgi:hypothetical protein